MYIITFPFEIPLCWLHFVLVPLPQDTRFEHNTVMGWLGPDYETGILLFRHSHKVSSMKILFLWLSQNIFWP